MPVTFNDIVSCTSAHERVELFSEFLEALIAPSLRLEPDQEIPRDKSFFELGLTSIGAVDLAETLKASLNVGMESSIVFNFPTLDSLQQHLIANQLQAVFHPDGERDMERGEQQLYESSARSSSSQSEVTVQSIDDEYVANLLKQKFDI